MVLCALFFMFITFSFAAWVPTPPPLKAVASLRAAGDGAGRSLLAQTHERLPRDGRSRGRLRLCPPAGSPGDCPHPFRPPPSGPRAERPARAARIRGATL